VDLVKKSKLKKSQYKLVVEKDFLSIDAGELMGI
jgi:hypothetical protein